jgi:hypothetical protein
MATLQNYYRQHCSRVRHQTWRGADAHNGVSDIEVYEFGRARMGDEVTFRAIDPFRLTGCLHPKKTTVVVCVRIMIEDNRNTWKAYEGGGQIRRRQPCCGRMDSHVSVLWCRLLMDLSLLGPSSGFHRLHGLGLVRPSARLKGRAQKPCLKRLPVMLLFSLEQTS